MVRFNQTQKPRILVTGAGGFIGSHVARYLHDSGNFVRGVDLKFNGDGMGHSCDEELILDLRDPDNCLRATQGMDEVYNFAANMGGIGFITKFGAEIMRDNFLINLHMLEASLQSKVERYLFASSACVYPEYRQMESEISGLREQDAYPADPDTFYGWEKLATEKICEAYCRDHGVDVRMARYHNIYGPNSTYKGGREKSPAALCRKVAEASDPGVITIWGDGKQTRSYCYIDDAVKATVMLMKSDFRSPVNIGSDRMVSINELSDIIIGASGKKVVKQYDLSAPQGVRGRNADIALARKVLEWEPQVSLEQGLKLTYDWILAQVAGDQIEASVVAQKPLIG